LAQHLPFNSNDLFRFELYHNTYRDAAANAVTKKTVAEGPEAGTPAGADQQLFGEEYK
jgi:hypothetical protein